MAGNTNIISQKSVNNANKDPFIDFYLLKKEIDNKIIETTFAFYNMMLYNCTQNIGNPNNPINIGTVPLNMQKLSFTELKAILLDNIIPLYLTDYRLKDDTRTLNEALKMILENRSNKSQTNKLQTNKLPTNKLPTNTQKTNKPNNKNKIEKAIAELIEFNNKIDENQKIINTTTEKIESFTSNKIISLQNSSGHSQLLTKKINSEKNILEINFQELKNGISISSFIFIYIRALTAFYKSKMYSVEKNKFIQIPAPLPATAPLPTTAPSLATTPSLTTASSPTTATATTSTLATGGNTHRKQKKKVVKRSIKKTKKTEKKTAKKISKK